MDIIKNNVIMKLNSEERRTLNETCELLNQITDDLDKNNYHWLITEETGTELSIWELREVAEIIEILGNESKIDICE